MHGTVLVTLTRAGLNESEHHGAYCVWQRGRVVRSRGNMEVPVFWRSAAKPIQALAVVESGACERFGLTDEELALTVASHSSEPRHAELAASILDKVGETPEILRCGGHPPLSREVADDYVRRGVRLGRLHDNCSGKHGGMIAAAKAMGADAASYVDPAHPVQRLNLSNMALLTGMAESEIRPGTDGCAAPTFAVPLPAMARGVALCTTPDGLPDGKAEAARRIHAAVAAHPELIGGRRRLSSAIVRATGGRLLAKSGAEAIYVVGVVGEETGIAIKVADGGRRAVAAVVVSLLRTMGLVPEDALEGYAPREVSTREGDVVGEVKVSL
ncbi:MAG: asparaginase [Planctomycetota bacterium]